MCVYIIRKLIPKQECPKGTGSMQ